MKSFFMNVFACGLFLLFSQALFAQSGTALPYTLSSGDLNNPQIFYYKNSSSIGVSGSSIELSGGAWNVTRFVDMAIADVAGEISVTFSLNTGSAFDKTTRIYASSTSDFASPRLLAERVGATGSHDLTGLLLKNERFIRIWFKNPDWSSTNCLVTKIKITKSCDASVKSLAGFSDSEQVLHKSFDAIYSNVGGPIRVYSDNPSFTVEPSTIGLALGASGQTPIQVTFSPVALGTLTGNIILEDTSYPASRAVVALSGTASVPTPTNFAAGTATFTTIPLSWDSISGVSNYLLEVYEKGGSTAVQTIDVGSLAHYLVIDLDPSTEYTFKVRAMLQGIYSGYAVLDAATKSMTPNLRIENVTANAFRVVWDPVLGVNQYDLTVVRVSDGLKFYDHVLLTSTSINVIGLDSGTQYELQLIASAGDVTAPVQIQQVNTLKLLPVSINANTGVNFDWIKCNNVNTSWEANGLYFKRDLSHVVVSFNDIPASYSAKLFVSRGTATLFDTYPNMYIEASVDGVNYTLLNTFSEGNPSNGKTSVEKTFSGNLDKSIRYLRISCSGDDSGAWGYLRDLSIVPLLPKALDATDIKGTSFVANWEALPEATDYSIELYKKDADGVTSYINGWENTKVGNTTSIEIAALERGVQYFYVVRGWFDQMITNRSNEISATTSLPIVQMEGELVAFQTVFGVPSEPQSVSVNCQFLETETTITAPESFSVSLDGVTYDNSVTMQEGIGQKLYVKLEGTAIQSYSGNLLIQTKGIPSLVIPITGSVAKSILLVTAPRQTGEVRRGQSIADIQMVGGCAINNLGDTVPGVFSFALPDTTTLVGGADQEFELIFVPNQSNLYQMGHTTMYVTVMLSFQSIDWDQTFDYMDIAQSEPLSAAASSGLPIHYISSDTTIIAISNDSIITRQPGMAVISAEQPGNSDYEPADGISIYVIVRSTTDLNQSINSLVMIYPNPVVDDLYVKADAVRDVKLLDMSGHIVKSEQFGGESEVKLNLSGLPRGAYMLVVTCQGGSQVKTVVKI